MNKAWDRVPVWWRSMNMVGFEIRNKVNSAVWYRGCDLVRLETRNKVRIMIEKGTEAKAGPVISEISVMVGVTLGFYIKK